MDNNIGWGERIDSGDSDNPSPSSATVDQKLGGFTPPARLKVMIITMVITLIGYRGTGKSTLAAPLARRLGWDWLDADVELERRAGRSIKEIFATDGEPEFRRLERELLAELLQRDRIVVAAGGGAILNEATRRDLKTFGPVIWLQASVDAIERRLATDSTTGQRRPNLTSTGGREEIERLLAIREPLYRECATIIVDADSAAPEQLIEDIWKQLPGELRSGRSA